MICRSLGRPVPRNFTCLLPHAGATTRRHIASDSSLFKIAPEVREALNAKKPVVALETTIYTHGYPYPENVALASELESIVRLNGGIPATIGIIDGVARVGLSPEELIELAASAGKDNTLKLSRRDLSYVLGTRAVGKRFNGGTTIAGTMVLAHLAGIRVFATGGLGGVHRGAESTMDVSADLTELGRTPVAVISSGCKSFLDIPRTLEYLETEGVTVGTFADGRAGKVDFPAFWSRDSGSKSPLTIADEKEAAAIIHAHINLPLHSGLHFANPIPEEASIPKADMDVYIAEAIREADAAGASGKDNTPFILTKIKELSNGKSLSANRSLIVSNVKRGTIVAHELALLESQAEGHKKMLSAFSRPVPDEINHITKQEPSTLQSLVAPGGNKNLEPSSIVVAGALACDYACDYAPYGSSSKQPHMQTSNPAIIYQSLGGVAHNVAKAAHYLGANVKLISLVGDDLDGNSAKSQLCNEGMRTDGVEVCSTDGARTARYVAINDQSKDLVVAMADMNLLNEQASSYMDSRWRRELSNEPPKWFVADANWDSEHLYAWFESAKAVGAHTALEPVSTAKGVRLFGQFNAPKASGLPEKVELPVFPKQLVDIMTPNAIELVAMHSNARKYGLFERQDWWAIIDALGIPSSGARARFQDATSAKMVDEGIPQQAVQLLPFTPCIVTKLGSEGALLTMLLQKGDSRLSNPDAAPYIISRSSNEDSSSEVGGVYMRLYRPTEIVDAKEIVSVNGVGDTFLGALIAGLDQTNNGIEDLVDLAQEAAVLTLKSRESVSSSLRHLITKKR